MSNNFYLEQLQLKNYRCFEDINLQFQPGINVILGNNGAGKTSILGGISIALGTWFRGIPNVDGRTIQNEELRLVRKKKGDLVVFDLAGECVVTATGVVLGNEDVKWERSRFEGGTTHRNAIEMIELANSVNHDVAQGKDVVLPVIAYYGTGRLWGERRFGVVKKSKSEAPIEKTGRYLGYLSALDPASNEKLLKIWISRLAEASFHEGKIYKSLTVVYDVITNCVEGAVRTFWDPRELDIVIEFSNGTQIPLYLMSDGQRNICATVGDIAMRCIQLNPHLQGEAPSLTPGVVLIDEVDLHLHPRWQKVILASLENNFPKIQFIVTTHSPFIVQSLNNKQVLIIDEAKVEVVNVTEGMGLEDTSEQILKVENAIRSDSFIHTVEIGKKMFELQDELSKYEAGSNEYFEITEKIKKLRNQVSKENAYYSNNPIVTAYLLGM
ncbi:AAA family ATPase [Vibrio fluvialis]|nr:AAA family ATPase [Vibrio fluvialis]